MYKLRFLSLLPSVLGVIALLFIAYWYVCTGVQLINGDRIFILVLMTNLTSVAWFQFI